MDGGGGGESHDRKVDLPTSESPRSRTVVSIGGGPNWVSSMVDSMNAWFHVYYMNNEMNVTWSTIVVVE